MSHNKNEDQLHKDKLAVMGESIGFNSLRKNMFVVADVAMASGIEPVLGKVREIFDQSFSLDVEKGTFAVKVLMSEVSGLRKVANKVKLPKTPGFYISSDQPGTVYRLEKSWVKWAAGDIFTLTEMFDEEMEWEIAMGAYLERLRPVQR